MEHHTNQRFVPKLSTSKSNQRAHMKTTKHNKRPQTEHQRGFAKMEDQQVQSESKKHHKAESETTNGAPERPEFFSKTEHQQVNQRAQIKHLKAQSKTTKGETKNQQKIFFRHFHLETVLIGQVTQLSQYYFARQRWHKALPSTCLYYTKHFSVLFLLQSLHKLLPSSTLYNKGCKNYFSVVLCATNLHKLLPSSTL